MEATKLEKSDIIRVLDEFAKEGILKYSLNKENGKVIKLTNDYFDKIAYNFTKAHKKSE